MGWKVMVLEEKEGLGEGVGDSDVGDGGVGDGGGVDGSDADGGVGDGGGVKGRRRGNKEMMV